MLLKIEEQTGNTPQALAERPELDLVLSWYLEQFGQLSSDRNYLEGGPLPLTTGQILTYFKAFDLYDFDDFYRMIRVMDRMYMESVAKKQKSSESKVSPGESAPIPKRK